MTLSRFAVGKSPTRPSSIVLLCERVVSESVRDELCIACALVRVGETKLASRVSLFCIFKCLAHPAEPAAAAVHVNANSKAGAKQEQSSSKAAAKQQLMFCLPGTSPLGTRRPSKRMKHVSFSCFQVVVGAHVSVDYLLSSCMFSIGV